MGVGVLGDARRTAVAALPQTLVLRLEGVADVRGVRLASA